MWDLSSKFDNGEIKKQRKSPYGNYELVGKQPKDVEKIALMAQSSSLHKMLRTENEETGLMPYLLEDYGVLEMKESVSMAKVVNLKQSMRLVTLDTDSEVKKLTIYKIKCSKIN